MKTYALVAIILIVAGFVVFAYQGITYATGKKAVDSGISQITATKTSAIPLLPLGGALALLGGISLLVFGERKTDRVQYLSATRGSGLLRK
ncbi:MAG: DUF3185 domain-containing protein [Proteobacteria bacterium]|nr:DUF3185 domain-containing protein [Pseudomonadota bacterium]